MRDFPFLNETWLLDRLPARISAQCLRQDGHMHMHSHVQFVYTLSGELSHRVRNEHFSQTKGSFSAVLPYTPHRTSLFNSEDTPVIIFISFFDDFLTSRGYDFFPFGENPHFEGRKIPVFHTPESEESEQKTSRLIRDMRSEFNLEENADFDRIASLMAELLRCICTEKVQAREKVAMHRRAAGVNAAVKHIEAHYMEKLDIDTLAEIAGMSRSTFTSHFRKICGISVLDFILSARLRHASGMLRIERGLTTDEIAAACGLYDHTNLVRVFKRVLGVTPSEYVISVKGEAIK